MTAPYERLCDRPRTDIDRAQLSPDERAALRVLRVNRSSDVPPEYRGQFTSIYYLAGDERAAARRFVAENREQLEAIDVSNPDVVQSSVPREVYDWILHFLGERRLRKYQSVVYERRPGGTEWVVDRFQFEDRPRRRYTTSNGRSVRIDPGVALDDLYAHLDDPICESDLRDHDAVDGAVQYALGYFCEAGVFDCAPLEVDGEFAVRKTATDRP
ncbi:hypothetical protein [Natrarchaeobaculum aegyptiacum]|uniref:Uncharacterized protein n=1 Tax=Natrarchaeobaculum aegyptiacum TaxID=745377 RepID=A0A2Z2HV74_9EURY|nr:hypothetical protein [Natrarchaeobaculum aegyptiacum]ARS89427.1 hypothetical protein B1756_06495 [Natrarchaeobaculum aegyptiacum]